jgi:hypothetical protein
MGRIWLLFGQFDQIPGVYDRKRGIPLLDQEFARHDPARLLVSANRERHERLIAEAAHARRLSRFALDDSWAGRVFFDVGSLFVRLGCRLEKYGFSRYRMQPAASLAVDCGCL